jgi:hypothetical protein
MGEQSPNALSHLTEQFGNAEQIQHFFWNNSRLRQNTNIY